MPFISLRESLTRSKAKWKERFRMGSNRPASTTDGASDPPSDAQPGSVTQHEPTEVIPTISASTQVGDHLSEPTITPNQPGENKPGAAWSITKFLLRTLESSTEAFGPLKSTIGGLTRCIDIYESASKGCKEYDELRAKLEGLLADLAKYTVPPMDLVMTNSVKRLCTDIEAELKNVEEIHAHKTGRRLVDAMDSSEEIMECYRRIHDHLERLTLNATMDILKTINKHTTETQLAGMSPAKSAIYNSAESDDLRRGGCAPGTRKDQIKLLLEWARNPDTGRTCWMNGMAGTGKTTIAYSVCEELDKAYELGASFFCSRIIPECRQIKYIVPSIAYQLARFSFPFRCALVKILESDPDAHARALKVQYQKLIVDPLVEVQGSLPTDLIVVIDALDECESEDSVGRMLDLLLSPTSALPIRYLLSSRPEPEISKRMANRAGTQGNGLLVLHDLDLDFVNADIATYVRHALKRVPVTEAQCEGLIERCGVLFIYASTTCRYIKQGYDMQTLNEAVSAILDSTSAPMGHGDETAIDTLYSTIITAAFDKSRISEANRTRMQNVLETVICAQEPMTTNAIAGILSLENAKQVDALLRPLRSVLNVAESTGLVTTLHASFPDFMFSSRRSGTFYCTQAKRHLSLSESCLRMIDTVEPKFNICGLPSSYLFDSEVDDLDERVRRSISSGLVYACRYWSAHLHLGEYHDGLVDIIHKFFATRLLIWMEILNLTKNMHLGTSIIREAENWCQGRAIPDDVAKIAHDAWEFVSVYANHPISQSTPHIYVSMLPFWSRSQPISILYMPRTFGMLEPKGTAIVNQRSALLASWDPPRNGRWSTGSMSLSADGTRIVVANFDITVMLDVSTGRTLLTIENASKGGISPDGTQIAVCGFNGTIQLLDASNGKVTDSLVEGVSPKSPIVFSHDGSRIAFGSSNKLYIYWLQRGELVVGPPEGHTNFVDSPAFSPDGLNIASGSPDGTIRLWDTKTGHMVGKLLKGHASTIWSICFSPDGSRLASGSTDGTIRVWDLQTGQTVLGPLKEHFDRVFSVAFSPNGALLASGSYNGAIRVYNAQTGQTVLAAVGSHTGYVVSVIFSPDSARLFSYPQDGRICLWNLQDIDLRLGSQPMSPDDMRSARYSPGGSHVASGSSTGAVYLWNIHTGEMVLGPLKGHDSQIAAVDFSPNNAYIASASSDATLRIWDAQDGKDLHGPVQGHTNNVNCVRFSPDSSLIVSGSDDGTARIWDVTSGQSLMEPLEAHYGTVSVAFSPDGLQVAAGLIKGTIRVWDTRTGQPVVDVPQGDLDEIIGSVEFSPDGSRILSASWEGRIWIRENLTGNTHVIHHEHHTPGDVLGVGFSPDGHSVVSCSTECGICVWDAQSGQLILGPLRGHMHMATSVQFSPDGSHVVSSSFDGAIRFWDVSSRKTNPQYYRAKADPSPSIEDTSDPWYLKRDGWVVDQQGQRLVWVPGDLHICLLRHPNDSIICHRGSLSLDFNGVNIGERWTDCYRP